MRCHRFEEEWLERRVSGLSAKVRAIAGRRGLNASEREEFYAEGIVKLVEMLRKNRDLCDGYLLRAASNRMMDVGLMNARRKAEPLLELGGWAAYEERGFKLAEDRMLLEDISQRCDLSFNERAILAGRLAGEQFDEIAKRIDVHSSTPRPAFTRLRRRIQAVYSSSEISS